MSGSKRDARAEKIAKSLKSIYAIYLDKILGLRGNTSKKKKYAQLLECISITDLSHLAGRSVEIVIDHPEGVFKIIVGADGDIQLKNFKASYPVYEKLKTLAFETVVRVVAFSDDVSYVRLNPDDTLIIKSESGKNDYQTNLVLSDKVAKEV